MLLIIANRSAIFSNLRLTGGIGMVKENRLSEGNSLTQHVRRREKSRRAAVIGRRDFTASMKSSCLEADRLG